MHWTYSVGLASPGINSRQEVLRIFFHLNSLLFLLKYVIFSTVSSIWYTFCNDFLEDASPLTHFALINAPPTDIPAKTFVALH